MTEPKTLEDALHIAETALSDHVPDYTGGMIIVFHAGGTATGVSGRVLPRTLFAAMSQVLTEVCAQTGFPLEEGMRLFNALLLRAERNSTPTSTQH